MSESVRSLIAKGDSEREVRELLGNAQVAEVGEKGLTGPRALTERVTDDSACDSRRVDSTIFTLSGNEAK